MKSIATETLLHFIEVMPEVPFSFDDIIIEFTKRTEMAQRVRELCEQYAPKKTVNKSQAKQLITSVDGNAIIGREKSVIVMCIDNYETKQELSCACFHEFVHIFCLKLEMGGEHFIDVYGSGTTPEREMTAEEEQYDGRLAAGYFVWSEFIAQYYALKHTEELRPKVSQMEHYIEGLLSEVGYSDITSEKYAMAFACSRFLTCTDAEEIIAILKKVNEDTPPEIKTFQNCLFYLHAKLQEEKPWKISEDFIAELGEKYVLFKSANFSR
jgi:hypothetical protein